jgi:CelD/BcsL family acetyltransferase involved in cellulose biosynthesis
VSDVREINDLDGLAEYRSAWSDLLDQTPGASFFQSLDWLEVYWRHFGAGQKLRVLGECRWGQSLNSE